MESTPYMLGVSDDRAFALGIEGTMSGEATLSVETMAAESCGMDLFTFSHERWSVFKTAASKLPEWAREMLFSYILCNKPQHAIAKLYDTTQTLCGSDLQRITRTIGANILYPEISVDRLRKVFERNGCAENMIPREIGGGSLKVLGCELINAYRESLSFREVAKRFGVRRSSMRLVMRGLLDKLTNDDLETMAVKSWLSTLLAKRHSEDNGLDERHERKLKDIKIKDLDSLGAFDQRINKRSNPSFFPSAHC